MWKTIENRMIKPLPFWDDLYNPWKWWWLGDGLWHWVYHMTLIWDWDHQPHPNLPIWWLIRSQYFSGSFWQAYLTFHDVFSFKLQRLPKWIQMVQYHGLTFMRPIEFPVFCHINSWSRWSAIDVAMIIDYWCGNVIKFPLFLIIHMMAIAIYCHATSHGSQSHDFPAFFPLRLCCTAARRWALFDDATEIHGLIISFPWLVGGDWNHGILTDFPYVGNGIWPQLTNSIIFQRGRYTTKQITCGYGWHWRRRASILGDVEGWTSIWPIKTSYLGYQGMGSDPYPC